MGFKIAGVPGDPTFRGKLSADGATISGDFTQAGKTYPVLLARADDGGKSAAIALEGFGDFVRSALKDWKVPGCAVAIVQGDRVILAEGYGLRHVQGNLPVTKDTLFPIGSSTKAFTVMALALLADEGKISWDTPVRQYLPSFKLKDLVATGHIVDDPTFTVTIALKGDNALTATVPNQPLYDLEPYRGTEFKLKGLTGFSARFLLDAQGAATELLMIQPNGIFTARRKG